MTKFGEHPTDDLEWWFGGRDRMSEPTIDEMLAWLDRQTPKARGVLPDFKAQAIRAILEQHREQKDGLTQVLENAIKREAQIEAIRAFVERVEGRQSELRFTSKGDPWGEAVYAELNAMERDMEQEKRT